MKSFFTRKSLAVVSAFFVASIVTSCHDEEVANIEEISYRHGYEYNFVKTFGEISSNQSWDFSRYALKNINNTTLTRATVNYPQSFVVLNNEGRFELNSEVKSWMQYYIPETNGEGHNNVTPVDQQYVTPHVLLANPEDAVQLIPIGIGQTTGIGFQLWATVVDPDTNEETTKMVWTLGNPGVWTSNNGQSWNEQHVGGNHGDQSTYNQKGVQSRPVFINFGTGEDINASSQGVEYPVLVNLGVTKPNTVVYFYLLITEGKQHGCVEGERQTSLSTPPQIVSIELPDAPAAFNGYNGILLGTEDENLSAADYDYNDAVFLLVGRTPTIARDKTETTLTVKKRYMIEDLFGYDYDFNDIVVDLTQITIQKYNIIINYYDDIDAGNDDIHGEDPIKPVLEPDGDPVITQEATFKWLCGTLPFQIGIGNYKFYQVTDPTNRDQTNAQLSGTSSSSSTYSPENGFSTGWAPSCTVNFSQTSTPANPWNPESNNISASIWTKGTLPTEEADDESEGVWTSTFPDEGDVPYIIAVDQDQEWTEERQIISEKIPSFNTTGWLPE